MATKIDLKMLGIFAFGLLVLHWSLSASGLPEMGTVRVTKEDIAKTVEMAVGDVLQIELVGTPSTGFWWRFETLDGEYLELIKEETKDVSPEKMEGAPIVGIWHVKAKKVGNTTIEMAYYRSWEGVDKTRDRFWLRVQITRARR